MPQVRLAVCKHTAVSLLAVTPLLEVAAELCLEQGGIVLQLAANRRAAAARGSMAAGAVLLQPLLCLLLQL